MTNNELLLLKVKLDTEYNDNYQKFINILKRLDESILQSPYERFLADFKDEDINMREIMWDIVKNEYNINLDSFLYSYLYQDKPGLTDEEKTFIKWYRGVSNNRLRINGVLNNTQYNDLNDSPIIEYKDTNIVITDPCYVFSKDWDKDWTHLCVTNFIYHSTLIGDWSATVFETQETNIQDFLAKNEHKHLGKFCADAGLVGVFDLQEILNYDGNFAKFLEKDFLVAQINNFTGTVQIKVDYIDNDFVAYVEGKGNVNFYGIQTGF